MISIYVDVTQHDRSLSHGDPLKIDILVLKSIVIHFSVGLFHLYPLFLPVLSALCCVLRLGCSGYVLVIPVGFILPLVELFGQD